MGITSGEQGKSEDPTSAIEPSFELDDGLTDVNLSPNGDVGGNGAGGMVELLQYRELTFFSHMPYLTLTLANGNTFHIYPKSKGQLTVISWMQQKMHDAATKADRAMATRWWSLRRRKKRLKKHMGAVAEAECEYYKAIFEDSVIPERHQEFTDDDYLALTPDAIAAIRKAFEESNDVATWTKLLSQNDKKKMMNQ